MKNKELGYRGEDFAKRYLEKKGYRYEISNYCAQGGEIDIICFDPFEDEYVLVEVKTRRNKVFGEIEETISEAKFIHMERAAERYFLEHKKMEEIPDYRIDILFVIPQEKITLVKHLKNQGGSF